MSRKIAITIKHSPVIPLGVFLLLMNLVEVDVKLTDAEAEWVYLADILREQTVGLASPVEKLQTMTEWLHEHVQHVPNGIYPDSFDHSSIASIIRGGLGNCGYQACNIVGFAQLLGYDQHRLLHHRRARGAPGDHTHAEIKVDGKWILFDPDRFLWFRDDSDVPMSVADLAKDTTSWIGISVRNRAYQETEAPRQLPKTNFQYNFYEKAGVVYLRLYELLEGTIYPVEH